MKKLILTTVMCIMLGAIHAQTLKTSVFPAGGGASENEGYKHFGTFGQPLSVGSAGNEFINREGFIYAQQNCLSVAVSHSKTICYNDDPGTFTSTVTAAEGAVLYQWQEWKDNAWHNIAGAETEIYEPGNLIQTTAFRLLADDPAGCGQAGSATITITVHDQLQAGTIISGQNQAICYGETPDALVIATPSGGSGNLVYQWQVQAGAGWENIVGSASLTFQPGALTQTTTYRLAQTDEFCNPDQTVYADDIIVTVHDQLTLTCPNDFDVFTNLGVCTASVTFSAIVEGTPAPVVTYKVDNIEITSPHNFPTGATTVVVTAENDCGLLTCSFTVKVTDNQYPTIENLPDNITKTNDEGICGAVVNWTEPTSDDNCEGHSIHRIKGEPSGSFFSVGTHTITYEVTDASGNKVSDSFTITITDDEAPQINCPDDVTISCEDSFDPADVGTATATDNCDANPEITYSDEIVPTSCTNTYTIIRTWKATDLYDNFSTCTQTITVQDITKPVVVVKDIVVELDPFGVANIAHDALDNGSTDNCTPAANLIFQTSITNFDCSHLGINQVMLTVTDECGNADNKTANITVIQGNEILPPWQNNNTHASANGTASYAPCDDDGTFHLTATGQSSSTNDVFHYVYQEVSGNQLTVIARLDDLKNGGWAGVMMRESCAPGARTFFFKTQLYSAMARVGFRQIDNRAVRMVNVSAANIRWMKVQRNGNQFRLYTSGNGVSWQLRYRVNIAMGNTIQAGIFTESMRANRTSLAWFDNVEVATFLKAGDNFAGVEIMDNDYTDRAIDLYPNPSSDQITITIEGNESRVNYAIMDMEGRLMQHSEFSGDEFRLDVSNFKPGLYMIRFEIEGEVLVRRIVVM